MLVSICGIAKEDGQGVLYVTANSALASDDGRATQPPSSSSLPLHCSLSPNALLRKLKLAAGALVLTLVRPLPWPPRPLPPRPLPLLPPRPLQLLPPPLPGCDCESVPVAPSLDTAASSFRVASRSASWVPLRLLKDDEGEHTCHERAWVGTFREQSFERWNVGGTGGAWRG